MDSKDIAMWQDMEKNPLKVHLFILVSGGRKALFDFVKGIAMTYKITLDVKPRSPNMVQRWKDISRCILKEVLPGNPSDYVSDIPDEQYISRGIYEAHVRRAYYRYDNVIVKATIINPDKMDDKTLAAIRNMVDSYNKKVVDVAREKGHRVTTLPELVGWR